MSESRRPMRVRLVVLLSVLGAVPSAFRFARAQQTDISAWYPVQPGDTWVYQKESDDGGNTGGMAHPLIERWKTEETIASVTTTPEGTLINKRTKVLDNTMLSGWRAEDDRTRREPPTSQMLIHQNCLYVLSGIDVQDSMWSEGYRDNLLAGNIPPDLCFPIAGGTTWGRVPSTSPAEEWVWHVKGLNADPFGDKRGRTFHLTAHGGSGTEIDRWFEPGVGVLQEVVEHHGHYDEDRRQLLRTVINGTSRNFDLKPAHPVASSKLDCGGVGWKHFVRENGSSFANEDACLVYEDTGKYVPR
jgi:hypothetical protein